MEKNFCTSCGQPLQVNARFCAGCGAPITDAIKETAKPSKPLRSRPRTKDYAIVLGALAIVTVAYFIFRTPSIPPQPPVSSGHAEVPGAPMAGNMEALKNLPTDYAGLVQIGNQLMDQGNFSVAAECYRRALAIDPSSPDVRTDFGACLHSMGLPQRALEEFRTVLASAPDHSIVQFNMGIVHHDMNQLDSARAYWEKYLQLDPSGPAAPQARELLKNLKG